jgi:hypothetical protein
MILKNQVILRAFPKTQNFNHSKKLEALIHCNSALTLTLFQRERRLLG